MTKKMERQNEKSNLFQQGKKRFSFDMGLHRRG